MSRKHRHHDKRGRNDNPAPPAQAAMPEAKNQNGPSSATEESGSHDIKRPNVKTSSAKWTDVAIVILTFSYVIVSFFQLRAMKGQLEQMDSSSRQTDQVIAEAKRFSTAAEENLKQSRAALDASITASHLEQRARIFAAWGIDKLYAGQNLEGFLLAINVGKTVAQNVRSRLFVLPKNAPESAAVDAELWSKLQDIKFDAAFPKPIFPNESARSNLKGGEPLTAEFLNDVKSGNQILYFGAEIVYEDEFGVRHTTNIFTHYDPASNTFLNQKTHNDAN